MRKRRGLLAVLGGASFNVVLATGTDALLAVAGIFPPLDNGVFGNDQLALALAYRLVYTFAGGYITAWIARESPMRFVMLLGVVGTALTLVGLVVGWNLPHRWYPLALALATFPATWLGGRARGTQETTRQ